MKSWLAQGSSVRRVTLLPETTFLHINGALDTLLVRGGGNLNDPIFKSSNARALPVGMLHVSS